MTGKELTSKEPLRLKYTKDTGLNLDIDYIESAKDSVIYQLTEQLTQTQQALDSALEALNNLVGNCDLYIDSYLGGSQNKELREEAKSFLDKYLKAGKAALANISSKE